MEFTGWQTIGYLRGSCPLRWPDWYGLHWLSHQLGTFVEASLNMVRLVWNSLVDNPLRIFMETVLEHGQTGMDFIGWPPVQYPLRKLFLNMVKLVWTSLTTQWVPSWKLSLNLVRLVWTSLTLYWVPSIKLSWNMVRLVWTSMVDHHFWEYEEHWSVYYYSNRHVTKMRHRRTYPNTWIVI